MIKKETENVQMEKKLKIAKTIMRMPRKKPIMRKEKNTVETKQ